MKSFFSFEKVEPMFGSGRRDLSVDVLRCLSCFIVCGIHASNMTYTYNVGGTGQDEWMHHEFYRMLFASPTVLFIMVSGIFFLSPERDVTAPSVWKKNILKMACAYAFWSLMYALFRIHNMVSRPEITMEFFLNQWLYQQNHLRYIPMIIGLYMICPILRPITATYDRRLFRYIVLLFIFGMCLWTLYYFPPFTGEESLMRMFLDKTPMLLLCQYPMWMLIGWIAYTYRPGKRFRIALYILGAVVIVIGFLVNVRFGLDPENYDGFASTTQKFSIFTFVKNMALYYFVICFFRDFRFSERAERILKKWSDCTLLIYLSHYMILYILHNNGVFYDQGVSPWAGVWLTALVAYFGGGAFALIVHVCGRPVKLLFRKTWKLLFHKSGNHVEKK